MNERHIIVIGLILVLIFVGLSGCEGGISDNPDRVYVHDEYKRTVMYYYQGSTQLRDILVSDSDNFIYHPDMEAYEIHGYIIHHAGRTLGQVLMEVNYYDDNGVPLVVQEQYFYNVRSGVKQDFLFRFRYSEYFETVKKVKYSFNVFE